MYVNVCISRRLKAELDWAIVNGFGLLFIQYSYTTKNLKNKAIFNLKQYSMCCYVTLSGLLCRQ